MNELIFLDKIKKNEYYKKMMDKYPDVFSNKNISVAQKLLFTRDISIENFMRHTPSDLLCYFESLFRICKSEKYIIIPNDVYEIRDVSKSKFVDAYGTVDDCIKNITEEKRLVFKEYNVYKVSGQMELNTKKYRSKKNKKNNFIILDPKLKYVKTINLE